MKKVVANGIITSLATYTFNGCSALECIYIKSESVPTASSNTFTNVPETCIIFVPETSVNAYKEANYWKNFIISPWLSSLEIVSTTPSMDFGNGEEANIDKDTKTFTITFNRNIVEEDNISATLKLEDEVVNDQVLTASYADNVLTLNREGERLSAGKYTLVLTTSESVLNITFNVINGGVGIENQSSEKIVHTKEYYTINGTALPQPIPGFNIIKITYEDGTVEVSKIYIRSSVNQ